MYQQNPAPHIPPCAVPQCNNRGNHRLPRPGKLREHWIAAIKLNSRIMKSRQLHILSNNSYICGAHFKPGDYITKPAVHEDKIISRLKNCAVPSIFSHKIVPINLDTLYEKSVKFDPTRSTRTYSRPVPPISSIQVDPVIEQDPLEIKTEPCEIEEDLPNKTLLSPNKEIFEDEEIIEIDCTNINHTECQVANPKQITKVDNKQNDKVIQHKVLRDVAVDTSDAFTVNECTAKNTKSNRVPFGTLQVWNHEKSHDVAVQTCDMLTFTSESYKTNKEAIQFYTGLDSYEKVRLVFCSLGDNVYNLKYFYNRSTIDPFEQFFMTLIILHCHKSYTEVSIMYSITIKQVLDIFITWVRFMSLQWRKLDLWPDKETIKAYMPLEFYNKYPNVRVVMGTIECPIKKPGSAVAQEITSTSVGSHTVKVLIGAAPSGLITYVSPCYGGSISDQQIFERCNILQRFEHNDEIMMDNDSNVQDTVTDYGVNFREHKRGRVTNRTQNLEKVIYMMKSYRILIDPMNRTETLMSSDIVFVCAMLVNFQPIIKTSSKMTKKEKLELIN